MNTSRQELDIQLATVAAYRGTDLYMQFIKLMTALEDVYRDDLLTVTTERLLFKQGAAAQVGALRKALTNAGTSPDRNYDSPNV